MKKCMYAWMLFLLSMPMIVFSQARQITGTVRDANGVPLPSVSVVEKGTTTGTVTNANGAFSINVSRANATLVFSYVGMESEELVIGTSNNYDVSLSATGELSEVVVTAMGIRKEKRVLGYSIQNVSGDDLNINRQTNVVNALQGKVSGVTISSTGGAPGQGARILIRG